MSRNLPPEAEQQLRIQLEAFASGMAHHVIGPRMLAGVGFIFVAADYGDGGGNLAYCSSVERADAERLLRKLLSKWDGDTGKCRRCSECRGEAHHWLEPEVFVIDGGDAEDPADTIVAQRCKHCDHFRPWDDSEEG